MADLIAFIKEANNVVDGADSTITAASSTNVGAGPDTLGAVYCMTQAMRESSMRTGDAQDVMSEGIDRTLEAFTMARGDFDATHGYRVVVYILRDKAAALSVEGVFDLKGAAGGVVTAVPDAKGGNLYKFATSEAQHPRSIVFCMTLKAGKYSTVFWRCDTGSAGDYDKGFIGADDIGVVGKGIAKLGASSDEGVKKMAGLIAAEFPPLA